MAGMSVSVVVTTVSLIFAIIIGVTHQHSVATCISASPCSGVISMYAGTYHSSYEFGNTPIGGLLVRPAGSGAAYSRYNFDTVISVAGTLPPGVSMSDCSFPCGYSVSQILTWQRGTTPTLASGNYEVTTTSDDIYDTPLGTCLDSIIAVGATATITCPADSAFTASDPVRCNAQIFFSSPTYTSSCPGATITISQTGGPSSGSFVGLGVQTISWQMFINGNPGPTCSHTVTVRDNSAPILTGCSGDINVQCQPGRSGGAVVVYPDPTISDCSPTSVVRNPPSGSVFPHGTTNTVILVTDSPSYGGSASSSSCNFQVTVSNANAPYYSGGGCPGPVITLPVTDPNNNKSTVTYPTPTFVDSCGDSRPATWVSGPKSGDIVNVYSQSSYNVRWDAYDPYSAAVGPSCLFVVNFSTLVLRAPRYGLKLYMYTPLQITWELVNYDPSLLQYQLATLNMKSVSTGAVRSFGKIPLDQTNPTGYRFSGFYGITTGKYYLNLVPDDPSITFVNNNIVIQLVAAGQGL